jgi:hypothetical protein
MVEPSGRVLLRARRGSGYYTQVELGCPDTPAVLNKAGNLRAPKLDFHNAVNGLRTGRGDAEAYRGNVDNPDGSNVSGTPQYGRLVDSISRLRTPIGPFPLFIPPHNV